jgi:hypothetical protein
VFAIEFGVFATQTFPALIDIVFGTAVGRFPLGMSFTGFHGLSFCGLKILVIMGLFSHLSMPCAAAVFSRRV